MKTLRLIAIATAFVIGGSALVVAQDRDHDGDREQYKAAYRQAYQQGYQQGFNGNGGYGGYGYPRR